MDNKGQSLPWMNLFTITVNEFPADLIPASYGPAPISSSNYQLTTYDEATKALLGSLVWGASWSDGGEFGVVTQVFPVLGGTGVYRHAKAVGITYQTDDTRQVTIYKSAFCGGSADPGATRTIPTVCRTCGEESIERGANERLVSRVKSKCFNLFLKKESTIRAPASCC